MESQRIPLEWLGSSVGHGGWMKHVIRAGALCTAVGLVGMAVVTAAQNVEKTGTNPVLAHRAEGLILARCSICHSVDLIAQQRLPRARWEATVEKMRRWGSELSDEEADLLVRHLSMRYHSDAPDHLPPLDGELGTIQPPMQETLTLGPLNGMVARGAVIFEQNCQSCHGAGAMGGAGPRLAKNPILTHEDLFWNTVSRGRGPMPAWGSVLSRQDIADIRAWLATR